MSRNFGKTQNLAFHLGKTLNCCEIGFGYHVPHISLNVPPFHHNWYACVVFTWMAKNLMTPKGLVEQTNASIESWHGCRNYS